MKKLTALVLAMVLLMSCAAADEKINMEIYQLDTSMVFDFDFDETEEAMELTFNTNEYGDGGFTLKVGDSEMVVEDCYSLTGELWCMHLGWNDEYCFGTMFMIPEYGMSDDPLTHCLVYEDGELSFAGNIYALPQSMTRTDSMTVTTYVRASIVGTWSRPADYVIAYSFDYDDDGDIHRDYCIVESPRDLYPMSMVVTLNRSLPLLKTRFDSMPSMALAADQQVVFTASDDVAWVYVTNLDDTMGGWFRLDGRTVQILNCNIDEVFSDIFYAD